MKKSFLAISVILLVCVFNFSKDEIALEKKLNSAHFFQHKKPKNPAPNDYWYQVRSYPDGFNQTEYLQKMELIKTQIEEMSFDRTANLDLPWLQEGPGNIGGRFNTLAMHPSDENTIYAGACNGGIFKTNNGGFSWSPIFDAMSYLAIGDITIDPNNPDIIYVGTGDKNFGGGSLLGDGIYKSTDAGNSWTQMGLEQTAIITKVIVDPTNSDRIFVSTLGNTYQKTTERGVYRSIDGGSTWQNILFVSDSSGVADLVMDPTNSDILYAASFNRINLPFQGKVKGPDSKIFKSIDGGDNWIQLGGGLPTTEESRVGLAISPTDPNTLYALYVDGISLDTKEIYKTTNGGTTWSPLGIPIEVTEALGGFGWYFGQIHINPYNSNQLIVPGVEMFTSFNGGSSWIQNVPDWWTYDVHADKHDVLFLDSDSYIIATDGGLYKTNDNGGTWSDIENIPVTQFYHVALNPHNDGLYGGGAQDNGSMQGNSFAFNNWDRLFGGDGFRMKWLDIDFGSAYYETQNGGLYYNGTDDISFNPTDPDRVNWDMPYVLDEGTGNLFTGSSQVNLMEFAPFGFYVPISGDLTKVGLGTAIGSASSHTITELEQPLGNENILYAGTSDGLVWRGNYSAGWSWTNITGTLPDRYVTAVRCSPDNAGTVFVGMSGYKLNEDISYLYKSTNFGATWQDVSGDLPGITVNDVLIVPGYNDEKLFAALDGGVYYSEDGGASWNYMGTDMPVATVTELALDIPNQKLIAGTFSRSMFSYDVSWLDDIIDPSAINQNDQASVKVYPNPVQEIIYFEGFADEEVEVLDAAGKLIFILELTESNGSINVNALQPGVYYYRSKSVSGKFVKS
jgi:photosystem II stability/assembly factor-like uncharacterized protein